ncbi:hypothetical protein ACMFMG_012033 [Clarireedia jacksonii]
MRATELSFLIEPQNGISADLTSRNYVRNVKVDGPYGEDLKLHDYETVILVAKGIGIAGLIPYTRSLTYRRLNTDKDYDTYRRGLITRKIDLYWVLDDNSEQQWVHEWFNKLRGKDSKNLILNCSCFFPHKKSEAPPVPPNSHWKFSYEKQAIPAIEDLIVKQLSRSAGRTKIAGNLSKLLACGTSRFVETFRNITIQTMGQYQGIEFAEVEYQPKDTKRKQRPLHHVEMGPMHSSATLKSWESPKGRLEEITGSNASTLEEDDEGNVHSDERKEIATKEIV